MSLQMKIAQSSTLHSPQIQSVQNIQLFFQTKLENEVASLRAKVQSLQVDLDNSEAVQRDFVKLSQSLQVKLTSIDKT